MKIVIETGTPRNHQCGDWSRDDYGTIRICTTDMPIQSQVAVAIHELIEMLLCEESGVTDKQVTKFDSLFEQERLQGKHTEEAEAGDDPRSPYRFQHQSATFAERAACSALQKPWELHECDVLRSLA